MFWSFVTMPLAMLPTMLASNMVVMTGPNLTHPQTTIKCSTRTQNAVSLEA